MNRLKQLAINEEGFIFDPGTGESFTANPPGVAVLKGLTEQKSTQVLAQELSRRYHTGVQEAERDVTDFMDQLRSMRLI